MRVKVTDKHCISVIIQQSHFHNKNKQRRKSLCEITQSAASYGSVARSFRSNAPSMSMYIANDANNMHPEYHVRAPRPQDEAHLDPSPFSSRVSLAA